MAWRPARAAGWLLALLVAGCAGGGPSTAPTSPVVPVTLRALETTTMQLGDRQLRVAVADTPDARGRGLIGVADLGPLDGLLFTYPEPVEATFHMQGVPVPLDIAFFDAAGRALAVVRMEPCEAQPCPLYRSPGPIRWALEAEAGGLADLEVGEVLRPVP